MNSLEGFLRLILPSKTTGASSVLARRSCVFGWRENHTLYYSFRVSREKALWAKGLCRPVASLEWPLQEFEDKVSRKQLPVAVTGVSQPVPTLSSCWNTVTSLIAQRIQVVGTETGAAMAAVWSFRD